MQPPTLTSLNGNFADFPVIDFSDFADAAFLRACGVLLAALQPISRKRSFLAGFQWL